MDGIFKGMMVVIVLLYVLSPVDLCPGPIDDILLVLLTMASSKNKERSEK